MAVREGDKFTWDGHELEYFVHPYNTTGENERAVEIPIASAWHYANEMMDPLYLEVGNVLSHYGWGGHTIVDRWEPQPVELEVSTTGYINMDVFELDGAWDRIVSVSTLEHVRWDPPERPEAGGSLAALLHLRSLLAPGGVMLVTVPFGQNPPFDSVILSGKVQADREWTLVKRYPWMDPDRDCEDLEQRYDHWTCHKSSRLWAPATDQGTANAVWVGEWRA